MMHVTMVDGEPQQLLVDTAGRYSIYIDLDSLIELAIHDDQRRARFVAAVHERGVLLFSQTHLAEIGRLAGRSAEALAALFTSMRRCWAPLDMNIFAILQRERAGHHAAWASPKLLELFNTVRQWDLRQQGVDLRRYRTADEFADIFFDLGSIIPFCRDEEDSIAADMAALDESLRLMIKRNGRVWDQDPSVLDREVPLIPLSRAHRVEYVFNRVLRLLIQQHRSHHIKKNDGMDFAHALVAMSCGTIVTLDRSWKEKMLAAVPEEPKVAYVFYRNEVDAMVDRLEWLVQHPTVEAI